MAAKKHKTHKLKSDIQPLVVGTLSTLAGLKKILKSRQIPCDWIEIRFDLIGVKNFQAVLKLLPSLQKKGLPIIGTFRSPEEGGALLLNDAKRLSCINRFLPLVDIIDIEASSKNILKVITTHDDLALIISYHNFSTTPPLPFLERMVRSILKTPGVIAKIACKTDTAEHLGRLRQLTKNPSRKGTVATLGMGKFGPLSRFWLPFQGSILTYGFLDKSAAPGQVPAKELNDFFAIE